MDAKTVPEIDDELAELEANAPGARGITQKIIDTVLRRREPKGTPTQGPRGNVRDQRGSAGQDRRTRRAMARMGPGNPDRSKQPQARLGRAKPVKSQAQIHSEFRAAARQQLLKIKLTTILPHCPEVRFVIEAEAPRMRNVWWLSQLDSAYVAAIPGLGPKRRAALLKYLHEHQVPTNWTADVTVVAARRHGRGN